MDTFPQDIRVMRIYWTLGDTRASRKDAIPNDVRNPATGGWCNAVVIGDPSGNQFNVLDPFYLQAFAVHKNSAEMVYAIDVTDKNTPDKLAKLILDKWEDTVRYGYGASYDIASLVLRRLGAAIPLHTTSVSVNESARRDTPEETTEGRGRRAQRAAAVALIKPVPRKSAKGRVLQWLIDHPGQSVKALQVDLDLKKTIVGAHLFLLHRDHGIGQMFDGDAVTVQMPAGCNNPFKD